MLRTTPLDDFLAETPASAAAVRLESIGLLIALPALMVSVGVIAYLASVHRGERHEVTGLVRVTIVASVVAAFGAVIEVLGASRLFEISWADAFADGTAAAPMMRLMAALMIALGLYDHVVPIDRTGDEHDDEHLDNLDPEFGDEFGDTCDVHVVPKPGQIVRWVPSAASAFALVGSALAVLSFSFDGHTVDTTPRVLVATLDVVHVTGGAIWLGGVFGMVVVSQFFRRGSGSVAGLLMRFSGVGALSLEAVAVAGALMSWTIVDGFDDYTGTAWGQRLIAKVVVVSVAAACGAYNHFRVVPQLKAAERLRSDKHGDERDVERDENQDETGDETRDDIAPAERIARRVLLIELVALAAVLALTVILVQASTV